jgi:hypothetical protein
MWKNVSTVDGNAREAELKNTAEFWGDMTKEQSAVYCHTDDYHSATNIISRILNKNSTTVLGLQKELVDEKKHSMTREAGREVERDMIKQRELYERRLLETREEMKEAIAQKDKKLIEQIAKRAGSVPRQDRCRRQGRKNMQIKMEELIKEKEAQHAKDMADLDKKFKEQAKYVARTRSMKSTKDECVFSASRMTRRKLRKKRSWMLRRRRSSKATLKKCFGFKAVCLLSNSIRLSPRRGS